jgi:glycosyltransferase involved in cell wall biosynthesis
MRSVLAVCTVLAFAAIVVASPVSPGPATQSLAATVVNAPAASIASTVAPATIPIPAAATKASSGLPSISICIPCIPKHLDKLPRMLRSIATQTMKPKEVIVALSSFTGDAGELEMKLSATYPVRILPTSEKLYAGGNRERAIKVATGDLIAFLDADDEIHPQRLEIISQLAAETNAKCILTTFVYDKDREADYFEHRYNWRDARLKRGKALYEDTASDDNASAPVLKPAPLSSKGGWTSIVHGNPTCAIEVFSQVHPRNIAQRGEDAYFLREVLVAFGPNDNTMVAVDLPLTAYDKIFGKPQ